MLSFPGAQDGTGVGLKVGSISRRWFILSCLLVEAGSVLAAAGLTAAIDQMFFAQPGSPRVLGALGFASAFLIVLVTLTRDEIGPAFFFAGENTARRAARVWNTAIFILLAGSVLVGRFPDVTREAAILFYALGFGFLLAVRRMITHVIRAASRRGLVRAQRIMIVGGKAEIRDFVRRHRPDRLGLDIVATVPLARAESDDAILADAVETARKLRPDDVYVALPWSDQAAVDRCLDAFLLMPVAIHLAPEPVLDRFERVTIAQRGEMASLQLTRPAPFIESAVKRVIDVVGAGLALLALLPLLAVVALLIKLDSRGPVLFRQTRFGLNQDPFSIYKFRSMTCFQDGPDVPQAIKNDSRVTRVGRWLRRTNLDELPQLLNVLGGAMSLVGPRPHAVPHNKLYERRIALYARRHNVRPGITGWAQVNGLRGETDTEDKMRARVRFDLHYIDNWSLLMDLRIILLTIFSRAAYRNAY